MLFFFFNSVCVCVCVCVCVYVYMYICVCLVVSDSTAPWTIGYQAPLSMEFSRQKYWCGLPFGLVNF